MSCSSSSPSGRFSSLNCAFPSPHSSFPWEDEEHDPVWLHLESGTDQECPDCGQHFRLECVGEGGYPYTGHLRAGAASAHIHH